VQYTLSFLRRCASKLWTSWTINGSPLASTNARLQQKISKADDNDYLIWHVEADVQVQENDQTNCVSKAVDTERSNLLNFTETYLASLRTWLYIHCSDETLVADDLYSDRPETVIRVSGRDSYLLLTYTLSCKRNAVNHKIHVVHICYTKITKYNLAFWWKGTHTHICLAALCPGLPGWAGTRKVKPIWILPKQETVSGSGISWAICKSATRSRQITTPAPQHSDFYRPDALPAAQPTVSKHWRKNDGKAKFTKTPIARC